MEYLPLGDLNKCFTEPLPEFQVGTIAAQLLEGLAKMHGMGFAHRDLKPHVCRIRPTKGQGPDANPSQNIFVVRKDPIWVKIGDFGISKRIQSDTSAMKTPIGTRDYLAPEVLGVLDVSVDSRTYTEAVDLWSLGCVLYYLLTRTLPFPSLPVLMKYCNSHDVHGAFPMAPLVACALSKAGVRFLRTALVPHPSGRATAMSALADPWIQECSQVDPAKRDERDSWTDWIMPPSENDIPNKEGIKTALKEVSVQTGIVRDAQAKYALILEIHAAR